MWPPFSVFPSYGMRTMFVKAHWTSSLGLSHSVGHCVSFYSSASCSCCDLEPFFRSLSSQKTALFGQAVSGHNLEQRAEFFPYCSRSEGLFPLHTDLGWCYVLCRSSYGSPLCPSPLTHLNSLCSWLWSNIATDIPDYHFGAIWVSFRPVAFCAISFFRYVPVTY